MQRSDWKDEIDFRDLLRKPAKLFGYSYFYFIAVLLMLGMMYLWNINAVGTNAITPVSLGDSTAFLQDIPLQSPSVLPPVDVLKADVPSDSMISRGRELFHQTCIPCHGDNGQGDGLTAATLNPKPRNFHSLVGWTNGSKVSQIFKTLQEGIVKNGMASYSYMPPADRFALAHYVRTFASGQPQDTKEDLMGLELTYQLSKGINTPGQIPIKKATQIIMRENAATIRAVDQLVAEAARDDEPGAIILRRVAQNIRKIVAGLHARMAGLPPVDEFVRSVDADPNLAGFKPAVTRLEEKEWSALYAYLGKLSRQLHAQG